jgi:hypothetical protein
MWLATKVDKVEESLTKTLQDLSDFCPNYMSMSDEHPQTLRLVTLVDAVNQKTIEVPNKA